MGKIRLDHKQLIHQIMVEHDPQGALATIRKLKVGDDAEQIWSTIRTIRKKIMLRPEFERREADSELSALVSFPEITSTDKMKLKVLMTKPRHNIHWVQTMRSKRLFETDGLQAALQDIKLFKDPFYEFDIGSEEKVRGSQAKLLHVTSQHKHERKRRVYNFSEEELDVMILAATTFIHEDLDWNKGVNSCRLLEALCLLTGRRKWELVSTLKIRSVPDSNLQAEIAGIAKIMELTNAEWMRVPLLAPISTIVLGISNLRKIVYMPGKYSSRKKLFPNMVHTSYRDLFAKRAYRDRHLNKFLEGVDCSELYWKSQALHIKLGTLANHYSVMGLSTETDEQPFIGEQPETMADPVGGS